MSAENGYNFRREQINRRIEILQKQLAQFDKAHAADPTNWGIVGDIVEVNIKLGEIVGFLVPDEEEVQ